MRFATILPDFRSSFDMEEVGASDGTAAMPRDLTFDDRLRQLGRKHSRIASNGYVTRMGPDGLVTIEPRLRKPKFPLRPLLAILAVAFCFKGLLLASMGAGNYAEKVATLQAGSLVEKAGAWLMQADPVTVMLAGTLAPYF